MVPSKDASEMADRADATRNASAEMVPDPPSRSPPKLCEEGRPIPSVASEGLRGCPPRGAVSDSSSIEGRKDSTWCCCCWGKSRRSESTDGRENWPVVGSTGAGGGGGGSDSCSAAAVAGRCGIGSSCTRDTVLNDLTTKPEPSSASRPCLWSSSTLPELFCRGFGADLPIFHRLRFACSSSVCDGTPADICLCRGFTSSEGLPVVGNDRTLPRFAAAASDMIRARSGCTFHSADDGATSSEARPFHSEGPVSLYSRYGDFAIGVGGGGDCCFEEAADEKGLWKRDEGVDGGPPRALGVADEAETAGCDACDATLDLWTGC